MSTKTDDRKPSALKLSKETVRNLRISSRLRAGEESMGYVSCGGMCWPVGGGGGDGGGGHKAKQ